MSAAHPMTLRVHQTLAKSHPEPMDRRQLAQRLGCSVRAVDAALQQGLKTECLQRVRHLGGGQGYGYVVAV